MNDAQHKAAIMNALNRFAEGNLAENARNLLNTLGYRSERAITLEPNTAEAFIATYDLRKRLNRGRALVAEWVSVDLLFQLRGTDLTLTDTVGWLFDPSQTQVDNTIIESYLFLALRLDGSNYNRTQLSQITREINKLFPMPAMLLFQHGNTLTLSVINRRLGVRDQSRDVLEKVTLIKDIDFKDTHRVHIDILFDLALEPLNQTHGVHNFVELHHAWEKTLDTEELNKKFYWELFHWFEWAVEEAKFPTDKNHTLKPEEHVIRLITRLLFVWFMKEKRLVAEELFNETQVSPLLKDYDHDTGDSYYRAVLQNLFFATLNTEIEKRQFSKGGNPGHRNFSRYRYKEQISDPDKLLKLFVQTPFINGGLFDCLDSEAATEGGGYRIDCFSDVHYKKLSIPNRLFFDKQRGLFPLLEHYKFTVEENTPIEQEVALDPELLGKVFENLLAAYNPETGATARKQTGSYYTPRAIVDHMVEEALIAGLTGQVSPTDGNAKFWEERLYYLFDYAKVFDDASEWFDSRESDEVVWAISELKILDPAVGSGAFPMGALHKLTLALRRLDHDNTRWEQLQKERAIQRAADAFDTKDRQARDEELKEISRIFENYSGNFGRKLYLIQNSIFGLDIQSIACQIAKLRFFISLAIEQEPDRDADNFGIKPLPNLETRFVAANTLIGLEGERTLTSPKAKALEGKLGDNRERHFHATTRPQKLACKREDKKLRRELATELRHIGMPADDADKVADWDPYDQNTSADWFDSEWMFGVRDGFDITIGNPPYVRADSGDEHLEMRQRIESSNQYETLWEKWDLYIPFIERSYKLLKPGGFTTLIVSDAYCHSKYAQKSQDYFLKNSRILRLDFLSKIKIFDAGVRNITDLFQKVDGSRQQPERRVHDPEVGAVTLLPTNEQCNLTYRAFFPEDINLQQFLTPTVALSDICYISYGLRPSSNEKTAKGEFTTSDLVVDKKDELHCKPFVEGKHLDYWLPVTNLWLEYGSDRAPSQFCRPTFPEMYAVGEKILAQRSPGPDPKVCYDNQYLIFTPSSVGFILWHSLSGIRNRSIKKQTRYRNETPRRPDLPEREELEKTSRRFAVKFLLGVMNATVARDFLRANRRSNIHLYPDDWKKLPIPDVLLEQQAPIIELVDQILDAKRTEPNTDVSELENEIDRKVSALYGISDE